MKKRYIILAALITSIFSSCNDFLEEENLSNTTAEDFYITAEGFNSLVNANYSQLREIYGGDAFMFCSGTDLYAQGRTPEPEGLAQYTELNPSSQGVDHIYNTCYKAIQTANTAMYYGDLTEQTPNLQRLLGEVKYLRANAYFLLVQTYGGVSLVTDFIDGPITAFDRNSAEEIYSFIISELEIALDVVSEDAFIGRVTKRSVQHLLAKVYLTRGYELFGSTTDFSTAASLADAAIAGQDLTIPFDELWSPDNQMNDEILFSVQYSAASTSTNPTQLGNRQSAFFSSYQGGSEVAGDAPHRTYTLCATQFAIDLFTQDDQRYTTTFMIEVYERYYDFYDVADLSSLTVTEYYQPSWVSSTELAAYALANPKAEIHPYGEYVPSFGFSSDYQTIPAKKFDDPKAPFSGERPSTRDIVLSRLGETYLIAAEAYLKSGDPTTGLMRLNKVRGRAGVVDATPAEFDIDYILDERGRELFGEYHRWFDLKRTGKLVERASAHHYLVEAGNFNGANGELKILRPIPQDAIDLNQNKDYPQNPAYN
ncbi:MAG: RagB/SusD family nutrient uptake outer membrane protein [Aestuariibaculum sp.]